MKTKNKFILSVDRSCKSFFCRPITFYPFGNCSSINTNFLCPIRKAFSFSSKSYENIISFVSCLFKNSNPPAILSIIIPIIVNSIYLCLLLSKFFDVLKIRFIHIISKFFKRFPETFYSTTAIIFVSFIGRIFTTTVKVSINIIKICKSHSVFSISKFHSTRMGTKFSFFMICFKYFFTLLAMFNKHNKIKTAPNGLASEAIY